MFRRLIILLFLFLPCIISAQKIGEKTNLLYLATSSPNVGLEFAWNKKITTDVLVGYNPWDFSGHRQKSVSY